MRTFRPTDFSAMISVATTSLTGRSKYVAKIAAIVTRFPERELEIHRQYARDPKFREICEDYEGALQALRHCEEAGPSGAAKAEDFRRIRGELEAEILGILDGPRGRRPRPDDG